MSRMEPEELADAIKRLTTWAETHAPEPEAEPRRRLHEHFGSDPAELPIVTRPLQDWDRPNLQVALDVFLADRAHELLGLTTPQGYDVGLSELARGGAWFSEAMGLGAAEHVTVPLGEEESITC